MAVDLEEERLVLVVVTEEGFVEKGSEVIDLEEVVVTTMGAKNLVVETLVVEEMVVSDLGEEDLVVVDLVVGNSEEVYLVVVYL